MHTKKVLWFLITALILGWLSLWLPTLFMGQQDDIRPIVQLLGYVWSPALAVLFIQKIIFKESLARYGWNRKYFSLRWIALAVFSPILLCLASLGIVLLMGNWLRVPGFGEVILNGQHTFEFFTANPAFQFVWNYFHIAIPGDVFGIIMTFLIVGILAGATFGLLLTTGQEVGWRGFMLAESRKLGFIGSNFVIGSLWGLWQIPLALYINGSPILESGILMEFLALLGYSVALSFPLSWLAVKTRSIYASATFNAVMNNVGGLSLFFLYEGDPLLTSPTGLAGMLVLLLITFLILRFDRKFVEDYPYHFF
ncbi:MAG: CPBP family glutamic-type intramembrane protease [Bacteroidota bacterium]